MRQLLVIISLLSVSVSAWATTAVLPTGSWSFANQPDELSRMEKAVDVSVDEMSFVMRPFARPKLKEICRPWEKLEISKQGESVTITTDRGKLEAPLGKVVERKGDDGPIKVDRKMKDGVLFERIWSDEGGRTNEYRAAGEGVVVRSKIYSPKLPKSVVFTYTYR